MLVNELFEELKEYKHQEINLYMMETQKMIKGFIKKVYLEDEESKNIDFIGIDIKEIKSDEDKLKKYSCKNKDKQEKNNKDRLNLGLSNLNELVSIEKEEQKNRILYKLKFSEENIGLIVYR